MPRLLEDQRSDGWRAARIGRITASVAAACLRLDPHTSAAAAWRRILGREKERDNGFMKWGRTHEETAIATYEIVSGVLVDPGGFWVHDEHDWLGASPDGLVGQFGMIEAKCPAKLPDRVPIPHRVQVQVQLMVTGRMWCDYICWTPDAYRVWRIVPAGHGWLLRSLAAFYTGYVLADVEPPRKKPRRKNRQAPLA